MGTPNVCNQCGNAYAGAFDNEFYCEQCKYDNTKDETGAKALLKILPAIVLMCAVLWAAFWLIGRIN